MWFDGNPLGSATVAPWVVKHLLVVDFTSK